ncbi:MAG TPA: DUF1822 family protein [Waterburya sp.]|jgi:hypothetical protein
MTNSPNRIAELWLDYEVLPTEAINLSPAIINQAVKLSSKIPHEERKWQTYLNVLALGGFEEWLESRATDLMINREQCSVLHPATANVMNAVSNLQVGEFKLCLIAQGSLTDEEISVPRAVVDLPEYVPHFYVLVDVQEEQETATVQSFLSYQHLKNRLSRVNLMADEDWTYQLPLSWFEGNPDDLLLNLRCLEPTAIPLPEPSQNRSVQLARLRSQLEALLPELQSPEQELWQVLTWEQGAVILTHPELLNWVYQLQQSSEQAQPLAVVKKHLADTLQLLTQPAVNAGRWLMDELDELAQNLSWVLLPSLAPATAMRSPAEEFEAIVTQLRQTDVEIPLEARGAYRDLRLVGMPLRLYAVTWPLLSGSIPEWTLLLVLGATPGTHLPSGLQLRVSDQTGILVERTLDHQQRGSYMFTRVIGTWDEKFVVTVSLPSGIEQTLPPFSFHPETR